MTIYELGLGDELANPVKTRHREIHDYLEAEKLLLVRWAAQFNYVIEVGCTYGRYAAAMAQLDKQYIDIDIVPSFIEKASALNSKWVDNVSFYCSCVKDLPGLINEKIPEGEKALIVFPFNVFGIIKLPACFWKGYKIDV